MILVDYRKGGDKKPTDDPKRLVELLSKMGIKTELSDLQYGDVAFEGIGPHGTIAVGIERKTLHDMLNCIDDARLSGHQKIGMGHMYNVNVLMVEGHWKPHDPLGVLMEGFNGGVSWGFCRYRSQRTMYSKLYRYLISAQLAGMIVSYSRDLWHTAYNIHEYYHYFQKREHTSFLEVPKVAIPTMNLKPSLVRKWANDIEGVGTKLSLDAEKLFKKPINLATSEESDWLRIAGIGVKGAQSIIRQIWGVR